MIRVVLLVCLVLCLFLWLLLLLGALPGLALHAGWLAWFSVFFTALLALVPAGPWPLWRDRP